MFERQESSPMSYLKQLSPIHRFSQVAAATIDSLPQNSVGINSNSIKLLSWNIAKNNHNPDWSQDFLAIIKQHQPDKILLQEVRLCTIKQQIPELASMGWSFAPNLIDNLHNTYSGVLTATKSDRLSSKALITQGREPVTDTPKVSLFVESALGQGGDRLLTVNTHLINFVETSVFKAQLNSIATMITQHSGAIILAGDFNTWNRSRWLILLEMTAELGLTPVVFPQIEAKKIKRFLWSPPLDYIFYRGLQQNLASAQVIDHIYSSDHKPLLVELYVEGNFDG